jgi:hypothetical protein
LLPEKSPATGNGQKAGLSTFKCDNSKNLIGGFEEFGLGAPQGLDDYYDDIAIDTKRDGPAK